MQERYSAMDRQLQAALASANTAKTHLLHLHWLQSNSGSWSFLNWHVMQESRSAMDRQLQAALASANTAKTDHIRQQLTLQAQTQALQQQLKDLRSEHEQLHDRLKVSDSQLVGPVSKPVGRPSVLNGVKGLLQRLNGSQNVQTLPPVSTPSLVIGQRQGGAETPKSVHCQSSGSSHMPNDSSSAFDAEVAGPSKQEGDDWDELLRYDSTGTDLSHFANIVSRFQSNVILLLCKPCLVRDLPSLNTAVLC